MHPFGGLSPIAANLTPGSPSRPAGRFRAALPHRTVGKAGEGAGAVVHDDGKSRSDGPLDGPLSSSAEDLEHEGSYARGCGEPETPNDSSAHARRAAYFGA